MPRKFKRVSVGGVLGVVPLSSASDPLRFNLGVDYIVQQGFGVTVPLDPAAGWQVSEHLFSAAPPAKQAQALAQLLADPKVEGLICSRGGYGAIETLPLINWEQLGQYAKPIVGISDATSFLVNFYHRSSQCCIHGPIVAGGFARANEGVVQAKRSVGLLLDLLRGEEPLQLREIALEAIIGAGEVAEGRLLGGNLSILASLLGTPWDVPYDDHIIFLEDVGEKPYRIHRLLMQLLLAGKFDKVRGVLLGEFVGCHPENFPSANPANRSASERVTLLEVFKDIFKHSKAPVWQGLPVGHGDLNLPLVIGASTRVAQERLYCLESGVA